MASSSITALIPPPLAADARVRALIEAFGACMDDMEDRAAILLSIADAPDAALPALAYEHSLSEFIGPGGLPVATVRTLIARAWDLHEPKGYAEGVEGGVALLGYPATLTQWWQQTPQGIRGTHRIEVRIDQPLWPGQPPASAGTVGAIWRMVHAMQRWSQDHAVRIVSVADVSQPIGVGVLTANIIQVEPWTPAVPEVAAPLYAAAAIIAGWRLTVDAPVETAPLYWHDAPIHLDEDRFLAISRNLTIGGSA